ncbi:MAG: hypothetical protein B7Y45_13530 [Sphingomonas sp. 28-66-16]|nr:MAG: hypothetical protein B7Y45_13530 [Sphingomonas sp. 28-66-16]
MNIDFEPIASVRDVAEVLAVIELRTLFYGTTYVADLEWDEDALLSSFLEQIDDPAVREDYRAEPTAGIQEAKGRLLSDLYALIEKRHGALAAHTPFNWDFSNGVLLDQRDQAELTAVAIGYLWLSLFWLMQSDKNYLIIDTEHRTAFLRIFAAVFELICCFVVTGRTNVATWYLGDSRDVGGFLGRLERISRACGSGVVKPRGELEPNQTGANDGGVDLIAVEIQDGAIRRDALAYLIGATLQRSDRRGKIMGIPEINRFTGYFSAKPVLAYKGMLAVPFARSEIEELNCRDQDCLYIGQEDILYYLGRIPEGRARGRLRRPGLKLLRATASFAGKLVMADNGQGRTIPSDRCALVA